jgi:hypothetical protein
MGVMNWTRPTAITGTMNHAKTLFSRVVLLATKHTTLDRLHFVQPEPENGDSIAETPINSLCLVGIPHRVDLMC